MVLTLPEDPDERTYPNWLPFKGGELMYTDGVKTSGFIGGNPRTPLSYIVRKVLMHSLKIPIAVTLRRTPPDGRAVSRWFCILECSGC